MKNIGNASLFSCLQNWFKSFRILLVILALVSGVLIWYTSGKITNASFRVSSSGILSLPVPTTSTVLASSSYLTQNVSRIAGSMTQHMKVQHKRKGLLLLTYHRSGSTFFGQYFNQRPDVFYIFEPLITFEDFCLEKSDEMLKVQHLSDLLSCRIRDQSEVFKIAGKSEDNEPVRGSGQQCIPNNFCFRQKIKLFCSEEFCREGSDQCKGCERVNLKSATEHCSNSKLVAIKVIRICHLKHLKPLFDDPSLDLKIVHLVRDPRGIYNSRDKLVDDVEERVYTTCDVIHESILEALSESESWLKSRYKMVRYEDLCMNPLQVAKEIYEFVGLDMTEEMRSWIANNTHASLSYLGDVHGDSLAKHLALSHKLKDADQQAKLLKIRKRLISNPYTTTRNSSSTWFKWITELEDSKIDFVQDACQSMMNDLGYNFMPPGNHTPFDSILTKTCPENIRRFCTFS